METLLSLDCILCNSCYRNFNHTADEGNTCDVNFMFIFKPTKAVCKRQGVSLGFSIQGAKMVLPECCSHWTNTAEKSNIHLYQFGLTLLSI